MSLRVLLELREGQIAVKRTFLQEEHSLQFEWIHVHIKAGSRTQDPNHSMFIGAKVVIARKQN